MTAPAPMPAPAFLTGDAKLIWEIFEQQKCLAIRKNLDYGSSFRKPPAFAPGIAPSDAILVRMGDKLERIKTLRSRGPEVSSESLTDTMLDLGTYAFLWVIAHQGCLTADDGKMYAGEVEYLAKRAGEMGKAIRAHQQAVEEAFSRETQAPGPINSGTQSASPADAARIAEQALARETQSLSSDVTAEAAAASDAEADALSHDDIDLPSVIVTDHRITLAQLKDRCAKWPQVFEVTAYPGAPTPPTTILVKQHEVEYEGPLTLPLYARIEGGAGDWVWVFADEEHIAAWQRGVCGVRTLGVQQELDSLEAQPAQRGHPGTAAIHIEPEHLAEHISQENTQERRILLQDLINEFDWLPAEFEIEGNPTATLLVTLEGSVKATGSGHVEYPCRVRPKGMFPARPWTVVFIHPDQMAREKDKEV